MDPIIEKFIDQFNWNADGSIEYDDYEFDRSSDEEYPFHESDDEEDVSVFCLFHDFFFYFDFSHVF